MEQEPISIGGNVSMMTLHAQIWDRLKERKFVLMRHWAAWMNADALLEEFVDISVRIGEGVARSAGIHALCGKNLDKLAIHCDGIYAPSGIIPYFALGCITPAKVGGKTRLFDARGAAEELLRDHPDIARTVIRYGSLGHPNDHVDYPLCHQGILRYRGDCETNSILELPCGYRSEEIYTKVENVIERCLIHEHTWERGDLLLVDNRCTLHDRTAFTGKRVMVRIRYDDPNVITVRYRK